MTTQMCADDWREIAARAQREAAEWRENFSVLQRALVGDTGASGIEVAHALRKDAERYRKLSACGKYAAASIGGGWGLAHSGTHTLGAAAKPNLTRRLMRCRLLVLHNAKVSGAGRASGSGLSVVLGLCGPERKTMTKPDTARRWNNTKLGRQAERLTKSRAEPGGKVKNDSSRFDCVFTDPAARPACCISLLQ